MTKITTSYCSNLRLESVATCSLEFVEQRNLIHELDSAQFEYRIGVDKTNQPQRGHRMSTEKERG